MTAEVVEHSQYKEVKVKKIGLDKLDVIVVFRKTFGGRVLEDDLIKSIAEAVGEAIEENNRKLLEELMHGSTRGDK